MELISLVQEVVCYLSFYFTVLFYFAKLDTRKQSRERNAGARFEFRGGFRICTGYFSSL